MVYGINSNIQAVRLTTDTGAVTGQQSLSIPLASKTITISSMCDFVLAFSYDDLFIDEKRMVLPGQIATGGNTQPITIPAPCGTNGQLWVVAYDAGPNTPAPNSFLSLMILE